MALSTTVSALTRDKFMPILVDNIFNSNVLCHKLLKNAELLDGGAKIVTPIEYAENAGANSGWLTHGSMSNTGQTLGNIAQKAEWDWATGYNSIVLSGEEQFVNSGASQVLSVLKARMSNAEKTFKDLIGDGLFNAGAVSQGITSLNGAGTVVSGDYSAVSDLMDTPTDTSLFHAPGNVDNTVCGYDRSLGGINSDSDHWWDAQIGTFSTMLADGANNVAPTFTEWTSTTNGVADGVKKMTQMYGACSIDNDQPDLIVTTQVIYDAYESSLQGNKRFEGDASIADAGFQSLRFKGASVVVDSHCPAGHMYFLNTKYLDFKVHSKRNFAFEDFKALEAKDGLQARIFWMGQLVCTNPRMQGLLVGGPTGY
tara:strand:+ start:1442 stop:2548 length:1107 start_codon:yes stop_codon:yes gene_type:complete